MGKFTKADLRTGDLVVTGDGYRFITILSFGSKCKNILIDAKGLWRKLENLNSNAIMKVYRTEYEHDALSFERDEYELIYDREAEEAESNEQAEYNRIMKQIQYAMIHGRKIGKLRQPDNVMIHASHRDSFRKGAERVFRFKGKDIKHERCYGMKVIWTDSIGKNDIICTFN